MWECVGVFKVCGGVWVSFDIHTYVQHGCVGGCKRHLWLGVAAYIEFYPFVHACNIHTHIRTYIHTYIHTNTHTHMHTYALMHELTCTYTNICAWTGAKIYDHKTHTSFTPGTLNTRTKHPPKIQTKHTITRHTPPSHQVPNPVYTLTRQPPTPNIPSRPSKKANTQVKHMITRLTPPSHQVPKH